MKYQFINRDCSLERRLEIIEKNWTDLFTSDPRSQVDFVFTQYTGQGVIARKDTPEEDVLLKMFWLELLEDV